MRRRGPLQRHRLAVLLGRFRFGTIGRLVRRVLTPPSFTTVPLRARPHEELLARNTTAPQVADHQQKRPTRIGKDTVHYSSDFQSTGKHPQKAKAPSFLGAFQFNLGNVLLSHTLARAVPSGLRGLTSVFGMGTGGSLSLQSPKTRAAFIRDFIRVDSRQTLSFKEPAC